MRGSFSIDVVNPTSIVNHPPKYQQMVGKQNSFIMGFTTSDRHNAIADLEPGGGRAVPQYATDAEGGTCTWYLTRIQNIIGHQ